MKRLSTTFLLVAVSVLCVASTASAFVTPYFTKSSTPFTSKVTSAKVIMKDTAGLQVACTAGTNEKGEVITEGSKKAKKIIMKFTGCETGTIKCTSAGLGAGEIQTEKLEGEVGYLEPAVLGAKIVAFALKAEVGEVIMKYTCGISKVEVFGCVVSKLSEAGIVTNKFKLAFEEEKGENKPESYEPEKGKKQACKLESSINGGARVREGWEFGDELEITAPNLQKIES